MSKKNLKIEKYESPRGEFVSLLRLVPIRHLDTVRERVKEAAKKVSDDIGVKLDVRVRFRGPRYHHTMHTCSWEANSFDVYVDTKNLNRRLSKAEKRQIADESRQEIMEVIRYGNDDSFGLSF